jgi:hypothetical protein
MQHLKQQQPQGRERAAGREGGAAGNRKRGEEERELQNCSNGGSCCRIAAGQER